jgi:hypothetical protein
MTTMAVATDAQVRESRLRCDNPTRREYTNCGDTHSQNSGKLRQIPGNHRPVLALALRT